jgi:aminoglycoside/choline kinase family phosphotransferase
LDKLTQEERAWMRILTTQFHCRLLGQCLLWPIRLNKPQYMRFLPRLEAYLRKALAEDPLLAPLKTYFDDLGLDFTLSNDLNIDDVKGFISPDAF